MVRWASVECYVILLVSGLLVFQTIGDLLLIFMLRSWQSSMVFKLLRVEVSRKLSSDALMALDLVFNDKLRFHPYQSVINKIRQFNHFDWEVVFKHTYKEGNKVADWLAKNGASTNQHLICSFNLVILPSSS
uniref:RNase H type-1 domain-containing protein n=1 Tax=Glycine max TaxID=3847 RepID=K7KH64_SOYBN